MVLTESIKPIKDKIIKTVASNFNIPRYFGIGVSYEIIDKLSVCVEFRSRSWNSSSGYNDNSSKSYKSEFQISSGIEIIPDAENVNSFFKRITYRGGLLYKKSPFLINSEELYTTAVTFGMSLPIGTISRINLGLELGKRGNIEKLSIKENYLKFIIGSSINNIWFIKRKFD